jgi:hypothetical protein
MGARELLADLNGAGIRVVAEDGRLVIRPASKLTDEIRSALIQAKPELLALLAPRGGPYSLTQAESKAALATPWDDAPIARFEARVSLFRRRGIDAPHAHDLAERLALRDLRADDDRRTCFECFHIRAGRCGNHRFAGLSTPDVSRDLVGLLQRCPGFACAISTASEQ